MGCFFDNYQFHTYFCSIIWNKYRFPTKQLYYLSTVVNVEINEVL